jgi:hypothetical protein
MRLGAQLLGDFCNVNDFDYSMIHEYNAGTNDRVYLQLTDLNQLLCQDKNGGLYQRYIPADGSTLTATIASVDDDNTIERPMTQVAGDPSLWYFDLYPTDNVDSANIHLTLTEPGPVIKKAVVIEGLKVDPTDPGSITFC